VVGVDSGGNAIVDDDENDDDMTAHVERSAPRVIHQAKAED
jgi:hypothetical protein